MSHAQCRLGLGHLSNNCGTASNTYLPSKALTSFCFGTLTVSLRLSSKAICSLRSSPRLRRSSCGGQWDLKLMAIVVTSLYKTKQSRPEARTVSLYYELFQRRIRKLPVRPSPSPGLPAPPSPPPVVPPAWSPTREMGTSTTKLRKGNTYSKMFLLKRKMAV